MPPCIGPRRPSLERGRRRRRASPRPPPAVEGPGGEPTETPAQLADFHKRLKAARALLGDPRSRKEAAARLEELRREYPRHPEVHIGLGDAALDGRDAAAAVAHYKEALAVKPGYPPAMFSLAKAHKAAGDEKEALAAYEAYLERRPHGPRAERARQEVLRLRAAGADNSPPTPF